MQADIVLGPDVYFDYSQVSVAPACPKAGLPGCAPTLQLAPSTERALSPFYVFVPLVSVSRQF